MSALSRATTKLIQEFLDNPCLFYLGKYFDRLKEILYFNELARLEQGAKKVEHWLDKDDVILAVHKKLKLTNFCVLVMA